MQLRGSTRENFLYWVKAPASGRRSRLRASSLRYVLASLRAPSARSRYACFELVSLVVSGRHWHRSNSHLRRLKQLIAYS